MHDELEWTEEERSALERLDREVEPGRLLEERTVAALRERGLLRHPSGREASRSGRYEPRNPRSRAAWWAAGIAAALALFLGGVTVGQARAGGQTRDLVLALRTADAADRASWVQRSGSLYVEALTSLAELQASGNEEEVATGAEVAVAALRAAALELARMDPGDVRYARILETLSDPAATAGGAGPVKQVVWF